MNREASGQVALLVDFENLIGNDENDSSGTSHAKRLVDFAKEYGRVVISKAYANWNYPKYGKYQLGIYDCGIEPVQVLGQIGKNSVDIKLSVDAVDMMRSLPYINVFIIVSSDKDFIHLYKILRVQGKIVIGIALHRNPILERSCDHFILYQNLAGTSEKSSSENQMVGASKDINEGAQSTGLVPVKQAIQEIVTEDPHGIHTATLKQLLRQKLSPSFDESSYGYKGFLDLLYALEDVVVLKEDVRNSGGLLLVYPTRDASIVVPEAAAPDAASGEIVSADSVAPEVTAPGATAAENVSAEDISLEISSYGTEDK